MSTEALRRVRIGIYTPLARGDEKDCKRIRSLLRDRRHVDITLNEAYLLWRIVSEAHCAVWLNPQHFSDDEVVRFVSDYMSVDGEGPPVVEASIGTWS